jgi:thiosulfate/3-mercaptopyruvate sulfurtransferase
MDVTCDELAARLGDPELTILDVRTEPEFTAAGGYPCDPRQGHVPGARHVPLHDLLAASTDAIRELVGAPEGSEVVAYCHSGQRSATAVEVLAAAGYCARNYPGSWHEWSHRANLPCETRAHIP